MSDPLERQYQVIVGLQGDASPNVKSELVKAGRISFPLKDENEALVPLNVATVITYTVKMLLDNGYHVSSKDEGGKRILMKGKKVVASVFIKSEELKKDIFIMLVQYVVFAILNNTIYQYENNVQDILTFFQTSDPYGNMAFTGDIDADQLTYYIDQNIERWKQKLLEPREQKRTEIEADIKKKNSFLAGVKQRIQEAQSEKNALESKQGELNRQNGELTKIEAEIAITQKSLTEQKEVLNTKQGELGSMNTDVKTLEQNKINAQGTNDMAKDAKVDVLKKETDLNAAIESAKSQVIVLKNELQKSQGEQRGKTSSLEALRSSEAEKEGLKLQANASLNKLQASITAETDKLKAVQISILEKNADLELQKEARRADIINLDQDISTINGRIINLNSKLSKLNVAESEAAKNTASDEYNKLDASISEAARTKAAEAAGKAKEKEKKGAEIVKELNNKLVSLRQKQTRLQAEATNINNKLKEATEQKKREAEERRNRAEQTFKEYNSLKDDVGIMMPKNIRDFTVAPVTDPDIKVLNEAVDKLKKAKEASEFVPKFYKMVGGQDMKLGSKYESFQTLLDKLTAATRDHKAKQITHFQKLGNGFHTQAESLPSDFGNGDPEELLNQMIEYMMGIDALHSVRVIINNRLFYPEDSSYNAIAQNNFNDLYKGKFKLSNAYIGKSVHGPFYQIMKDASDLDVASDMALLCKTRGQHYIYSSYGFSGSGKTYTLIQSDKSILVNLFEALKKEAAAGKQTMKCSVTFSDLYGELDDGKCVQDLNGKYLKSVTTKIEDETLFKEFNLQDQDVTDDNLIAKIKDKVQEIDMKRKNNFQTDSTLPQKYHIRCTPNNKESSRSHLFVEVQVNKGTVNNWGKITIMDMGGSEDVEKIQTSYFETLKYTAKEFTITATFEFGNLSYLISEPGINYVNDLQKQTNKWIEITTPVEYMRYDKWNELALMSGETLKNEIYNSMIHGTNSKLAIAYIKYNDQLTSFYEQIETSFKICKEKYSKTITLFNFNTDWYDSEYKLEMVFRNAFPGLSDRRYNKGSTEGDSNTRKQVGSIRSFIKRLYPLMQNIRNYTNENKNNISKEFNNNNDRLRDIIRSNTEIPRNITEYIEKYKNDLTTFAQRYVTFLMNTHCPLRNQGIYINKTLDELRSYSNHLVYGTPLTKETKLIPILSKGNYNTKFILLNNVRLDFGLPKDDIIHQQFSSALQKTMEFADSINPFGTLQTK